MKEASKVKLWQRMVKLELAADKASAKRLCRKGVVSINGRVVKNSEIQVATNQEVEIQ